MRNYLKIPFLILVGSFSIDGFAVDIQRAENPIPGEYIVILKGDTGKPATAKDRVNVDVETDRMGRKHGFQIRKKWQHAVKGYVAHMSEQAAMNLAKDSKVAIIEENAVITANSSTTQQSATWGLDRVDQTNLPLESTYTYDADGSGVRVYVIDSGIRRTHNEFGGRAIAGFTSILDGLGANDCNGHGTHVAGTIGGSTFGVAKGVTLIPVRVLDCNGQGTLAGVISAVNWVTQNRTTAPAASHPAVANMSLGGDVSSALDAAVNNSINADITYVVAAGNDNKDACQVSPARVAAAITVGASDTNDNRAVINAAKGKVSNYGPCVDIYAPGVDIISADYTNDTLSKPDSGTSMAAPHVAGAAALYLSRYPTAAQNVVASSIVRNKSNSILYTGYIRASLTPPNVVISDQDHWDNFYLISWDPISGAIGYEAAPDGLTAWLWDQTAASATYEFGDCTGYYGGRVRALYPGNKASEWAYGDSFAASC